MALLIVLYCIVLYCIVLYCIVLYCIVLYCIVLYCIVLYCIVLYCIVLYCIVFRRLLIIGGTFGRMLSFLHYRWICSRPSVGLDYELHCIQFYRLETTLVIIKTTLTVLYCIALSTNCTCHHQQYTQSDFVLYRLYCFQTSCFGPTSSDMRTAGGREATEAATRAGYDSASDESDDESSGASFQDSDDDDEGQGDTAGLPSKEHLRWQQTRKLLAYRESTHILNIVTCPYSK